MEKVPKTIKAIYGEFCNHVFVPGKQIALELTSNLPVGELECFVKGIAGHGPEWVNKVIEAYPDFSDEVYEEARKFIKSMKL